MAVSTSFGKLALLFSPMLLFNTIDNRGYNYALLAAVIRVKIIYAGLGPWHCKFCVVFTTHCHLLCLEDGRKHRGLIIKL